MENIGDIKMENKTLILSVALLTGLAISAGDVNAAGPSGKVNTHIGTIPVKKTSVINTWPESQVKGYLGKGKMAVIDENGNSKIVGCSPIHVPC